jgi:DNA-binding NarL/FixJ family response regulator
VTKLRILVADDHEVVRQGMWALLEIRPEGEVCAEAANGRDAVELAKQTKLDVVVMDISMPELNGLEATRQILKALPRTEVLIS